MTRPTLTVVGKGEPGPDVEAAEAIARGTERMAAAVKDPDGVYWLLTVVDGEVSVGYYGGKLESACLVEAVASDMKRAAVGL